MEENKEYYTREELEKMVKELQEDNKQKDNIIMALEYRLEKLEVKPQIQVYDYEHPTLGEVRCTRHTIPEFTYVEYQNFIK